MITRPDPPLEHLVQHFSLQAAACHLGRNSENMRLRLSEGSAVNAGTSGVKPAGAGVLQQGK